MQYVLRKRKFCRIILENGGNFLKSGKNQLTLLFQSNNIGDACYFNFINYLVKLLIYLLMLYTIRRKIRDLLQIRLLGRNWGVSKRSVQN